MTSEERIDRLEEAVIQLADHVFALLGTGHAGALPSKVRFSAVYAIETDVKERREAKCDHGRRI